MKESRQSVKKRHRNDPNFLQEAKADMHETTTDHCSREEIRAWRSELEDYAAKNPSQPNMCVVEEWIEQ